jgi:hypothetical protein
LRGAARGGVGAWEKNKFFHISSQSFRKTEPEKFEILAMRSQKIYFRGSTRKIENV